MKRAILFVSLLALASGCSINKIVANNMDASFRDATLAFNEERIPRAAREAAPALMKMVDGFIVSSPENEGLLLRGAEMNATFAFGFIEEEDPEWARDLYRKAMEYGRRALAQESAEALLHGLDSDEKTLRAALAKVRAGDGEVAPLFWVGFAWGGFINVSRQDQKAIAELPKVVAIMERLCEIAPDFYHGGPHMFLAVYYSSRGSMLGGDVKKSAEHFDRVMGPDRLKRAYSAADAVIGSKNTPKRPTSRLPWSAKPSNLLAMTLYARFYCVALGEKEPARARTLFTDTLNDVLDFDADSDPENRLQSAIAQARAKKLLPQLDDLILPPMPDEPGEKK